MKKVRKLSIKKEVINPSVEVRIIQSLDRNLLEKKIIIKRNLKVDLIEALMKKRKEKKIIRELPHVLGRKK